MDTAVDCLGEVEVEELKGSGESVQPAVIQALRTVAVRDLVPPEQCSEWAARAPVATRFCRGRGGRPHLGW